MKTPAYLACALLTLAVAAACNSTVVVQPCSDGDCGGEGAGASGAGGEGAGGSPFCGPGEVLCGKECVDTSKSFQHCGGCFSPCDPDEVCSGGECSGGCPPSLVECNGACVDIFSDPSNCGSCGFPCSFDEACFDGSCFLQCPPGLVDCGVGYCVDLFTDQQHCSACFSPCGDEEFCSGGICQGTECPGESECGICDVVTLPSAPSLTFIGDTFGAQNHYIPSCTGAVAPEVAHQFTAPLSATYTFDTIGSSYDTVLGVLGPGGCFESACNDDSVGVASAVQVDLSAGDTVTIVVDGFTAGEYLLNVSSSSPCPCGACGAIPLPGSVPQSTTGDTSGAPDDLFPSCTGAPGSEIVHSFTAPTTGSFIFSTASSGFDTVLTLLDANTCGELGCNDDFGGQQTSRITATLSQGQTVYVVVDGKNASGFYNLFINGTPVSTCPTADLGDVVPVTISGNTQGSPNLFAPSCTSSQAPDHQYTFTAPITKTYTFDTIGSAYDTALYVLGATCGGASLACDDDTFGLQSQVNVSLAAGQTVTVVVDGFNASAGSYVLNIE